MSDLSCTVCGAGAAPGAWRCECGGPLDLPEVPAEGLAALPARAGEPGLWRYRSSLPLSYEVGRALSMGEGMTPLIEADGLPGVSIKVEYVSPTLSFKDRGAVTLIAAARERGARSVIADSSGNAGAAIAAYAARAGIECRVFVPERTSRGKIGQIRAYGAQVEAVAGDRSAAAQAALEAVQRTGARYASHVFDPYFLQGTKTFAFEVWEQLGRAPAALIVPAGNGTLLLGAERGFRELLGSGLIDRMPALIAVQSERCAPLAQAFEQGLPRPAEVDASPTAAEGIAIARPARGVQMLAAVRASEGCFLAIPEEAIVPAQAELAHRGLLVEPTAALVWAATLLVREAGVLADVEVAGAGWDAARRLASSDVVVPLCGSGLKSA